MEKKDMYELKQVPTEYGVAIVDSEDKTLTLDQAIVLLLNKVANLEELIVGTKK